MVQFLNGWAYIQLQPQLKPDHLKNRVFEIHPSKSPDFKWWDFRSPLQSGFQIPTLLFRKNILILVRLDHITVGGRIPNAFRILKVDLSTDFDGVQFSHGKLAYCFINKQKLCQCKNRSRLMRPFCFSNHSKSELVGCHLVEKSSDFEWSLAQTVLNINFVL